MLSTDRNIFKENSPSKERMIEYGKLVDELRIIIFSLKKHGYKDIKISENIFLHPTNSLSRFFYIFNAYNILKKLFDGKKNSVIITCQDPFETGIAGYFISKKFHIPLQIQVHTDFLSPFFTKESLLNKIRVIIARRLITKADGIRVVSKRIKKSIIENLKISELKISVLPVYVDMDKIEKIEITEDLRKKYPEFDFIIFMASRLSREKNINLALKAVKEVIKIYPKTGLVIAGGGKEKENILKEISKTGIEKNVKFLGNVEFKALISYYKTTDIYLLTSNYEGYAMSAVEAVASGAPVVMTDVGIANSVLINKKDALIISVGDLGMLKNTLINLIKDENLRKTLAKNAKNIVNLWKTKEEYLKEYYNLWMKLLI